MDLRYEQETVAVEDHHWWYAGRRTILAAVLDRLAMPPGAEILDAGCGSGRNMVWLARFGAVTGLELSEESLSYARGRDVGPVVAGSVEDVPFDDDSFDLATSFDVIEHLDDARGLAELARVVRPRGHLFVSVPAYPWLWGEHDVRNHHRRRYTRDALLAAAREAGWTPRWTSHFNALLLPAAVAHRLAGRLRRDRDAHHGHSEFALTPARLNPLLRLPLEVEATLLRRGRRLPLGLSLLGLFEKPGR